MKWTWYSSLIETAGPAIPVFSAWPFGKMDDALAGASGVHQFHPQGHAAKPNDPHDFKIYFHQPNAWGSRNSVRWHNDGGYSAEAQHEDHDERDAILTHAYSSFGIRVSAALDSRPGGKN